MHMHVAIHAYACCYPCICMKILVTRTTHACILTYVYACTHIYIQVWHVGLYRDPSTQTAIEYYNRFQDDAGAGLCKVAYILDFCLSCGKICTNVCAYEYVCMFVCGAYEYMCVCSCVVRMNICVYVRVCMQV